MARRQKKYHYIYKTTCNVNGKYYIGMHSTDNLDDSYVGSGKRLWNSINYHGRENHTKEILEFCENRAELKKREAEIVNEQLINEELCMNLKTGGDGGFTSEEHRSKFLDAASKTRIHMIMDPSEAGVKGGSTTFKRYGTNQKIFKNRCDWNGREHSDETKKKMSETKKGKGTGKANSQYGTCWITNGEVNKKVNKEELEQYLHSNEGWRTGRVIKK